jgi:hypothetical protein
MYEDRNVLSGGLEASPEAWESFMWVLEDYIELFYTGKKCFNILINYSDSFRMVSCLPSLNRRCWSQRQGWMFSRPGPANPSPPTSWTPEIFAAVRTSGPIRKMRENNVWKPRVFLALHI